MSIHVNQNAFFEDALPVRRRDNIQDVRWPEGWWLLPMVAGGLYLWASFFTMVFG